MGEWHEGECNARLRLGDDYGDNVCTLRCQLASGHEGLHAEDFLRDGGRIFLQWEIDEGKEVEVEDESST